MGDPTHPVTHPQAATAGAAESIEETVQGAAESALQAVDFRGFVQEHPWLAVGGAVALGFVAEELLRAASHPSASASASWTGGESRQTQESSSTGEPLGKLASWLGDQFGDVKTFAAGSVMNYVHSLLARGLDSIEEGLRAQGGPDQSRDGSRPQQENEPAQGARP